MTAPDRKARIRGRLCAARAIATAWLLLISCPSWAADKLPVYHFDLAPQSLSQALKAFSQAASQQIIFAEDVVRGMEAPALRGSYTTDEALRILLSGTGLEVEHTNTGTLMIKRRRTSEIPGTRATEIATADSASVTDQSAPIRDGNTIGRGDSQPANGGELRLDEVVVTAQKRAEDLQVVPVSVQVISGQALTERNFVTLEDLSQTVPSIHVSTGQVNNSIYIRGIGSGQNAAFDQSVGMFVDDVYYGRSRMSGATFLDLDHVEVLKGPQSTYFGNNAIAGAVNIVTKKPGDHFEAWGSALYGMYGQYAVQTAVGGPITHWLGVRVAGTVNGSDGWIKNEFNGEHVPITDNKAARITALLQPTENFDATVKVEASDHQTAGIANEEPFQVANCPPPAPLTPAYNTVGGSGGCLGALALHVPIGLDSNVISTLPGQFNTLTTVANELTMNLHEWDHTFTSVSAFYDYHYNAHTDETAGNLPAVLITNVIPESYHQFSQELRVASRADQVLEYMVGGYFQTDQLHFQSNSVAPALNFLAGIPGFGALNSYLPIALSQAFGQGEDVYSAFGSLKWNATDALKLNAGLRGIWVSKDTTGTLAYGTSAQTYGGFVPMPIELQPLVGAVLGAPGTQQLSRNYHGVMPSGGLQYVIRPEVMAYFSYNRGYKAGGINGQNGLGVPTDIVYGPEHVNAYELGIKSKWFADSLLFNFDLFRSNYSGLQVPAIFCRAVTNICTTEVGNAGTSVSQGVELETQWLINEHFRLSANLTYLDSHYVSYKDAPPTTLQMFCGGANGGSYVLPYCGRYPDPVPSVADLSGFPTLYAPKWSGSLRATYTTLFAGGQRFTADVSPFFTSSYNPDPDGLFPSLGNYVRWDGRLQVETADGHWAFAIIGKNLADRVIATTLNTREEPRNVAAQVHFTW